MVETRASILNVGPKIIAPHAVDGGVEFVQAQLHPQFRDLMDDDEQHLVVLVGQRMLRIQQLVEIEVLRVAQGLAQVPMHLLRRSNRRRA